MMAEPRRICGQQHLVEIGVPRLEGAHAEPGGEQREAARRQAGARRRGARAATAIGAVMSWATPVTSMICADLERAVVAHEARNTGIR